MQTDPAAPEGSPHATGEALDGVPGAAPEVEAYVLVQTHVGRASEVARAIRQVPGVVLAEGITGPYDIVVRAAAHTVDELGRLVVAQVQAVPGITRTVTCPVVRL